MRAAETHHEEGRQAQAPPAGTSKPPSEPGAAVRREAIPIALRDPVTAKGVWEWPTTLRSLDTVTLCHLEATGLIVGQGGLSQGSLRCQSGGVNSCPEARMQSTQLCWGLCGRGTPPVQEPVGEQCPHLLSLPGTTSGDFCFPSPGECRRPDSQKETPPPGLTSAPLLVRHFGLLGQEASQQGTASPSWQGHHADPWRREGCGSPWGSKDYEWHPGSS